MVFQLQAFSTTGELWKMQQLQYPMNQPSSMPLGSTLFRFQPFRPPAHLHPVYQQIEARDPYAVLIKSMGTLFSHTPGEGDNRPISDDGLVETVTISEENGVKLKTGEDGSFTAYNITIKVRDQLPHQVYRRYKFFARLHDQLQKQQQQQQQAQAQQAAGREFFELPSLPGKKLFGSTSSSFVNKRRLALQFYLQELGRGPFGESAIYLSFLGIDPAMLDGTSTAAFDWAHRTGNAFGGARLATKLGGARSSAALSPQQGGASEARVATKTSPQ